MNLKMTRSPRRNRELADRLSSRDVLHLKMKTPLIPWTGVPALLSLALNRTMKNVVPPLSVSGSSREIQRGKRMKREIDVGPRGARRDKGGLGSPARKIKLMTVVNGRPSGRAPLHLTSLRCLLR